VNVRYASEAYRTSERTHARRYFATIAAVEC
jgi:hypothetical protein